MDGKNLKLFEIEKVGRRLRRRCRRRRRRCRRRRRRRVDFQSSS